MKDARNRLAVKLHSVILARLSSGGHLSEKPTRRNERPVESGLGTSGEQTSGGVSLIRILIVFQPSRYRIRCVVYSIIAVAGDSL
jgi:hypothetical protein